MHKTFKINYIALNLCIICNAAYAGDRFNATALQIGNPDNTPVDLSSFSRSGDNPPGIYRVEIRINKMMIAAREVDFQRNDRGELYPRLTLEDYVQFGVNINSIASLYAIDKKTIIKDINQYIPDADIDFDFSKQRLNISIPQAFMKNEARNNVNPELWDDGIPAVLLSYNLTGSNTDSDYAGKTENYFSSIRSGINAGAWRLRNYSTWSYSLPSKGERQKSWDSINTWAQRDLKKIRGKLIVGQSYTPSDIFESVQFTGALVATEDNMLPDSLRGFAPTVQGIANSNAQITISQNGITIYQTTVPPGPFTISDLYPTSASGELNVTIREADGSERSFTQAFSNVPMMQREGQFKYALVTGKYRNTKDGGKEPFFGQGTLIYGLPYELTLLGGILYSGFYQAANVGIGMGLGEFGAISADITQSLAHFDKSDDTTEQGQSIRFLYSKTISATNSIITLAGYRYSTENYYSLSDAVAKQNYIDDRNDNINYNKKSKVQIVFQQNLFDGRLGSLSISGYQQDYWNQTGKEKNVSISYTNTFDYFNFIVAYSNTKSLSTSNGSDEQISLNISIPLSRWARNTYSSTNISHDNHGNTRAQTGINGSLLEGNNLRYNVYTGYGNNSTGNTGIVNVDYLGSYGETNLGYSYTNSSKQINYGVQGTIVAHPYGVTLGQPVFGDMSAVALIKADGASGISVQNKTGVRTDWRGYTVVPYLNPYKQASIVLRPDELNPDIELTDYAQNVIPTAGAVVLANYKTNIGSRVLMTLHQQSKNVPFGATVTIAGKEDYMAIVGDDGEVFLSGMPHKGRVTAVWDEGSQSCNSDYVLPDETDNRGGIFTLTGECL